MAPTLPSTASQDTDAMSVDYSTGSSLPPKTKSKPAAAGSKASPKAVKPAAAGSKASSKAVKPAAAGSKTSPKTVKPAAHDKTKKSAK